MHLVKDQVQPCDNPVVASPWDHLDVVPDKLHSASEGQRCVFLEGLEGKDHLAFVRRLWRVVLWRHCKLRLMMCENGGRCIEELCVWRTCQLC